ncbi:MAG: selenocysteine lyase/cysteine desulfurase [Aureispira sp.]|jgi:selenocysteine lyase/cysteine desulfurase
MNNRRSFFKQMIGAGAFGSFSMFSNTLAAEELIETIDHLKILPIKEAIQSEDSWKRIQEAYSGSQSYLNLNNGGVSPQPTIVLSAQKKYLEQINEMPSRYLARELPRNRFILREKLAKLGGCLPQEIAFMQNATEGMNTVMLGIDWKAGDEVIVSKQDYSTVKVGWEQLEKRHKIKLIWVNLPAPIENDEAILEIYLSKITKKTRFINLTQVINWTGQIIPVSVLAKICTEARKKGIFTLIDGAHSLAHLDFKISDLQCDAYASSLHKWLCAPIGTGMLYMRQDKIASVWSMYPSDFGQGSMIEKFEHKGTVSLAREEATHTAIQFHQHIGIKLKEARLRYLKNYWAKELQAYENVQVYTSFKDKYAGGIALFGTTDRDINLVSTKLERKYRIHHTQTNLEGVKGIRISPNIYTSLDDLDRFLEAMNTLLKN